MTFIVTADAGEINVDFPGTSRISAAAIAWSLSQINRFNGHASRPYSVAEHSLLVCEILEREMHLDVHGLLAGLLHDAHESVSGDMHSPGKATIGAPWKAWEDGWEHQFRSLFAIHTASKLFAQEIRRADLIALATERRDLMPSGQGMRPWRVLAGIPTVDWVDLNDAARQRMTWADWRDRWTDRLQELEFARDEGLTHTAGRRL